MDLEDTVASALERRAVALSLRDDEGPEPLATLKELSTCSNNASRGGLIVVDGPTGWLNFDFATNFATESRQLVLRVFWASEDSRPVMIKLDGQELEHSGSGFCSGKSGGWGVESVIFEDYGPFAVDADVATHSLQVCNLGPHRYFPHIERIEVFDAAAMVDVDLVSSTSHEMQKNSLYKYRSWIVPPSQELRPDLAASMEDIVIESRTQEPNPDFVPDPVFYDAINCEGLWVCASKQCGPGVLERAAALMRAIVPKAVREMCLQWRAPVGRPRGPMRVVILDNVSNQQAGDCPDFPSDWGGRNGTSNPGCFTSAEDLRPGKASARGELTVHESMHLIDMVIRQQLDPFFMQQVDDCFQAAARRGTYKKAYARANRHEYIAELLTLFGSTHPNNFKRGCAGCTEATSGTCDFPAHQTMDPGKGAVPFDRKSHLRENDPDAYALLQAYMSEPAEPHDDRHIWQVLGIEN